MTALSDAVETVALRNVIASYNIARYNEEPRCRAQRLAAERGDVPLFSFAEMCEMVGS
jgi:hypothetical protein